MSNFVIENFNDEYYLNVPIYAKSEEELVLKTKKVLEEEYNYDEEELEEKIKKLDFYFKGEGTYYLAESDFGEGHLILEEEMEREELEKIIITLKDGIPIVDTEVLKGYRHVNISDLVSEMEYLYDIDIKVKEINIYEDNVEEIVNEEVEKIEKNAYKYIGIYDVCGRMLDAFNEQYSVLSIYYV